MPTDPKIVQHTGLGERLDALGLAWGREGLPQAEKLFEELLALSDDGPGVTRAAYTSSESAALDFIERIAEKYQLQAARDPAANLVISLPGQDHLLPFVFVGSHLDSVPHGGNYDGAAGVIAGLLCLIRLRLEGRVPPRGIKLLALRGEESPWFETACLGSRALFGELAGDLARHHRSTGLSLREHLKAVGANVDLVASSRKLVEPDQIAGYYELHIEQGPVMVERKVPVAIVSGIRGILRFPSINCFGEEGHSGAVPRELRRDPVSAVVDLLHRIDRQWTKLLEQNADLVITSGVLSTPSQNHSPSRIAGEIAFSLDVRSIDLEVLKNIRAFIRAEMEIVQRDRKVRFKIGTEYLTAPEKMDSTLRAHLTELAERYQIPYIEIASGSGHDAMVFARNHIPTAMIFVRNEHGSHNPNENMSIFDFLQACELLYRALSE
jgi:beta-ureidopropionase / N-carbamoyl-L-amino-acid hydrolase